MTDETNEDVNDVQGHLYYLKIIVQQQELKEVNTAEKQNNENEIFKDLETASGVMPNDAPRTKRKLRRM